MSSLDPTASPPPRHGPSKTRLPGIRTGPHAEPYSCLVRMQRRKMSSAPTAYGHRQRCPFQRKLGEPGVNEEKSGRKPEPNWRIEYAFFNDESGQPKMQIAALCICCHPPVQAAIANSPSESASSDIIS